MNGVKQPMSIEIGKMACTRGELQLQNTCFDKKKTQTFSSLVMCVCVCVFKKKTMFQATRTHISFLGMQWRRMHAMRTAFIPKKVQPKILVTIDSPSLLHVLDHV